MTRKEAIKNLKELLKWYLEEEMLSETVYKREAVDLAISALSEEDNTMEWIPIKVGKLFPSHDYKCSWCRNTLDFNGVNCGRGDANFCPNCGRKAVSK